MNLLAFRSIVHAFMWSGALTSGVIMAGSTPVQAAHRRMPAPCAVWVVRNALSSAEAWRGALEAVERAGCDRMYLQVSGRWDSYAPSSVFSVPEVPPSDRDPFDRAVHDAKTLGIEVHAWVNAMLAWSAHDPPTDEGHVYNAHPDWFVVDSDGRSMRGLSRAQLDRLGLVGEGWFLDPGRVEVRTELRRFVLEIATRYPVDGVHLDYIRYPAGWAPVEGAAAITRLVGMIREDLRMVRPSASLSAAVLPVPVEARRSFGQAWADWLAQGLIDEVVPMVYRSRPSDVIDLVRDYAPTIPRARVRVGLRLDRLAPAEVATLWCELAHDGFAGTALFSHNLLNEVEEWN